MRKRRRRRRRRMRPRWLVRVRERKTTSGWSAWLPLPGSLEASQRRSQRSAAPQLEKTSPQGRESTGRRTRQVHTVEGCATAGTTVQLHIGQQAAMWRAAAHRYGGQCWWEVGGISSSRCRPTASPVHCPLLCSCAAADLAAAAVRQSLACPHHSTSDHHHPPPVDAAHCPHRIRANAASTMMPPPSSPSALVPSSPAPLQRSAGQQLLMRHR